MTEEILIESCAIEWVYYERTWSDEFLVVDNIMLLIERRDVN